MTVLVGVPFRAGRPTAGELAATLAVLATGVFVVIRPPVTGSGAAWTVAWLVLGVATVAVAGVVRRGAGRRGPAAWTTAAGIALLAMAVVAAAADRDAALLGVATRATCVLLGLVLPGLVLTFPTGRLDHVVDRVAAAVVAVCGVAVVVAPIGGVALPAGIVLCTAVAVGVGARFERSRDLERERILWLLLGLGGSGVVVGHLVFASEGIDGGVAVGIVMLVVALAAGLVAPVSVGVALLVPRLADVRTAISGVAAAVVMVDLALGVFAGGLAVIEIASGAPSSRVATGAVALVVAAGFHPALVAVRGALDQVLFGGRPDPVDVVSSLGDELRRGGGPQRWLDTLRAAAELPSAELRHAGERIAVSGDPTGPTTTLALHAGDDHVGDLVVGLPEHHHELPRGTEAVLRLVAAPLARALQSARLAEELQQSRRMVVLAAEEERRRLRRDLHDGLGPVLAGVAYTADAARNVLDTRPGRTAELLGDLRADVTGAIDEVRRIVHDLRPPVLDQLGLVPALRQQAARVTAESGPAVVVTADALGALPAAVEVVAYRLVTEAVLNVVRHAHARAVRVDARRDDDVLDLLVVDDGVGGAWTPGVGLTAMRERVEQLDGELDAGATPDGGRVHARLPLPTGVRPS